METNYNIQTGRLIDKNGKSFDITVILNFPTQADYAAATSLDDFPATNLIDFYFGATNDHDTDYYVEQFIEKQAKFRKLVDLLTGLSTGENESEMAEHIKFIKSLIVQLH